jgi:hypothetical protein
MPLARDQPPAQGPDILHDAVFANKAALIPGRRIAEVSAQRPQAAHVAVAADSGRRLAQCVRDLVGIRLISVTAPAAATERPSAMSNQLVTRDWPWGCSCHPHEAGTRRKSDNLLMVT